MKFKKAFTLIELLVVIAIIGILATISVLALNNARAKSRDAKRAGDMKQIQTALELFFNDKQRYPTADEFGLGSIFSTTTNSTSTYMKIIPTAPTPSDGNCSSDQNTISYIQTEAGNSYSVSFCLGNTTGSLTPGPKCLTPGGIMDIDCSTGGGAAIGDSYSCPDTPVVAYEGGLYDANGISTTTGGYYRTTQVESQCWLRDNLNAGTMLPSNSGSDNQGDAQSPNTPQKYCYNNNLINPNPIFDESDMCGAGFELNCGGCDTDGGLYQWHTIMGFPQVCDDNSSFTGSGDGPYTGTGDCAGYTIAVEHQGLCPSGWHIPNETDWHALELAYAIPSDDTNCDPARDDYSANSCSPASTELQKGGSAGFEIIRSGYRGNGSGGFYNRRTGGFGYYWSSRPVITVFSIRRMFGSSSYLGRDRDARTAGYAARCIKD